MASEPRLGSLVRVLDRAALEEYLRSEPPEHRPEPEQMTCVGRHARICGVRPHADRRPRYLLSGLPGLWPEDWLQAV